MIFLAQRWNRQPPWAYEIDWSNPITRGLAAFYDLRRISISRNLATGKSSGYTVVGNGATFHPTGIRTSGDTSNYITMTANFTPSSPPWSVVDARRTLSGSVPWCVLGNTATWYGAYGSGSNAIQTPQNNDFSGLANPTLVRNDGSFQMISNAFVYRGLNDLRGCCGGQLLTDTTVPLVTNPGSFRPLSFGVSNMDIIANGTVAHLAYWGCFNRALSNEELKEWGLRPWQAVKKQQRRLYFGEPITGGYVLTASAANFSFAGATATVKLRRKIMASAANFSFAGATATVKLRRKIMASAANFSFAGVNAGVNYNWRLVCSAANFSFAGADAVMKLRRKLICSAGNFSFAGSIAGLNYSGAPVDTSADPYRGFIVNTGRLMR